MVAKLNYCDNFRAMFLKKLGVINTYTHRLDDSTSFVGFSMPADTIIESMMQFGEIFKSQ